jgi:prepilin-type N-terminal cleavage/methylation domain-containing protein
MTHPKAKREAGFTLIEVMVAMTIMLVILAATLGTLTDAIHATEGVTLMADTQENLRAGMNYVERDLVQAGEGLPQSGIPIPSTAGVSAVNRPGPAGIGTFPTSWTVLPDISPGYRIGLTTGTSGVATDMITVIYADNTLLDSTSHYLNEFPINTPGGGTNCTSSPQKPNGTISTSGSTTTITFDSTCVNINTGNTALAVGDLILLQANGGGSALLSISSVNLGANQIVFNAATDPFLLNNSGKTTGTISQVQSPAGTGTYTTTTATRVWMVTYFIANSTGSVGNPAVPMLMRQVNMRPAQAVGEVIENMQFFYDVLTAGSVPPTVTAEVANPSATQLPYIRDAYVLLFARSENTFSVSQKYFRNNLSSVVNIRSLNFYNEFK